MNRKIISAIASVGFILGLTQRIYAVTVTNEPDGSVEIRTTPEEGVATTALHNKERIAEDLWTLLLLLDDRSKAKDYALVNLVVDNVSFPNSTGVFGLLDLHDPTKPPVNVPYTFRLPVGGNIAPPRIYDPYFVKGSILALCVIDARSLPRSAAVPDTLMLPPDWTAEMIAKLLTSADNTQYLAAFNRDFSKSSLATLIYGVKLAENDFSKFTTEYPRLMSESDAYTGSALTTLLLSKGRTSKPAALTVTQADSEAELTKGNQGNPSDFDEINKLLLSTTKSAVIEGITLGLWVYRMNYLSQGDERVQLLLTYTYNDLLSRKESLTDPQWQMAMKLERLLDSLDIQMEAKRKQGTP